VLDALARGLPELFVPALASGQASARDGDHARAGDQPALVSADARLVERGTAWIRALWSTPDPGRMRSASDALHVAGIPRPNQGDLDEAVGLFETSLASYRVASDRGGIAKNLGQLGPDRARSRRLSPLAHCSRKG
jgi:hypothetical protein